MQVLWQDLRFGFRMLRRNPGFSILAILCLTLGIGATTAVFSWIEGVLLRPFPLVAHQERMMAVAGTYRGVSGAPGTRPISPGPISRIFRGTASLFDAFIVDRITGVTLAIGDRADRTTGSVVSANYFDALGVRPILGRGFEPAEDFGRNAHPVDRDQLPDVERAFPWRSGDHRQNADAQRHAAHHHRRCAGRLLWHFRRLGDAVLGPGVHAGTIRLRVDTNSKTAVRVGLRVSCGSSRA